MSSIVTVSNTLITAILDGVPLSDPEKDGALGAAGLTRAAVADPNERSSILALNRLWRRLVEQTGDDFLGLQIGTRVPGHRFGLAVHAATNADTFRNVLVRFSKFAALINALIRCGLDEPDDGKYARFTMKFYFDALDLERHAVDITLAGVLMWARAHVKPDFELVEVRLRHAQASARKRYEDVFEAPITFGAPINELVIDPADLALPVAQANPELGAILERFASAEASEIPNLGTLPARILQILERELRQGRRADLPSVAGELKMAPRHIQRKLKESSTSFSDLLDDARKALAPSLLAEASANVEQVGFKLGYAEPTAFIRAFKKWFGVTPGSFKKNV